MPIVRLYPNSEILPLRIPDAAPNVPAAGDIDLFGGNRARDLQVAGQQLGQASDSLFALYDRHAQQANDTRVQDFNNQFITGMQQILRTGPEAYFNQKGADAIRGAGAATERLATLKEEVIGQAPNDYQRRKLAPILDAHFDSGSEQIARHVDQQQQVYERNVHLASIEVAEQEAISNPDNLAAAVTRAADATRALYKGQAPEVIESEARKAGSRVVSSLIKNRLVRNARSAVGLYRQYGSRLDPEDRAALGTAVDTLSNQVDAAAWVRDSGASLSLRKDRTPMPTGDAALDAVNAASASLPDPPPPVTSAASPLLDQEGVAGYRQRLDEIEDRRRALTALSEQEFAANPARLRANRAAIETHSAQKRAAVNAEVNGLYADLRLHLTTGGPNGGPAVTLPPATIMSRLTDAQQEAVASQVRVAIEGRRSSTDPQTWYAIRRGLMADDADERQRWASKNLVPFMGRLSEQDFVGFEKLQALVRDDGDGAEQRRLQDIGRLADRALRSAGIDPTPQPDAAPDSDAAQAARFHRALQDELSAFESQGRTPTAAEAYDIVDGVKQTAINSGWLKVSDDSASPTLASDFPSVDDALHEPGAELAQAEPPEQPVQRGFRIVGLAPDFETFHRQMEEERQREAAERSAAGPGGAPGAPSTEPYPGSTEYEAADAQARDIAAEQTTEEPAGNGSAPPTEPPPGSPEYQTAEEEARRVADRQEADDREADRMTTRWVAQRRDDGAPPKLPSVLAERLSPAEKEELETLAATPDTPTDREEYNRILRNLLNYNSQVRLKWAREPLYRYRKSLSSEDFAKLARIQSRLDPDTGQVSGFAPVPADLVPVYDRLAPDPDWHYGTIIPLKRTPDGKDWDFAMPSSARTFLKGILDLLAGVKTGELTTDALESFVTLHTMGGRAFGPLGDAGTLVAGGNRRSLPPPKAMDKQSEKFEQAVERFH